MSELKEEEDLPSKKKINLNLRLNGVKSDTSAMSQWEDPCCNNSVMKSLFQKGSFSHIIEDIFDLLEPKALFNCSLVCKDWNNYLKQHFWSNAQGEQRIIGNWLHKAPLLKEIPVPLTQEEKIQLRKLGENSEDSRLQCPMFIVMIGEDLICAVAGKIQVFDKNTGDLKKCLDQKLELFFWKFSASKNYLIAYQGGISNAASQVYCWDRQQDYQLRILRGPGGGLLPINNLSFIKEDLNNMLLLGESGKKLLGLKVDLERQLKIHWCTKMEHQLYSVTGSSIITCRPGEESDLVTVEILDQETGTEVHELMFNCGEYDSPKGLSYSNPLGIALMCKVIEAEEDGWLSFTVVGSKLFFFDMAHGFLIREIVIDYSRYFSCPNTSNIRVWCDPPLGTLLMAAHGKLNRTNELLAWNLLEVLHNPTSEKVVDPHRVFDVDGFADADAIAVSNHELVHAKVDQDSTNVVMVKRSFWGRFK